MPASPGLSTAAAVELFVVEAFAEEDDAPRSLAAESEPVALDAASCDEVDEVACILRSRI